MLKGKFSRAGRYYGMIAVCLFSVAAESAVHTCRVGQGFIEAAVAIPQGDRTYHLSADRITGYRDQSSLAQGGVSLVYQGQILKTEHLLFNKVLKQASTSGGMHYQSDHLFVNADSGEFQFDGETTAQIESPEFFFSKRRVRGAASRMEVMPQDIAWLKKAEITTCPKNKGGWLISASKVKIDEEKEWVTARNVVLRFQSVPIFYSPYISFSLNDKRKSGFLLPDFGVTGSGFELELPFYWNIAPNRDAMFSLHHLQRRGELLKGEFRYLEARQHGQLNMDYLAEDRLRDNKARGRFVFEQHGAYSNGWYSDVLLHYASDKDYFVDLAETLGASSQTHLERSIATSKVKGNYAVTILAQSFQTLDKNILPQSRPYQKLPELKLNAHHRLDSGFSLQTHAEAVNFQRANSVSGARIHLEPMLSYTKKTAAFLVSPSLGLSHTAYFLDNTPQDTTLSRTLPKFSLHSRLLFERSIQIGKTPMIQTLEPEIFYLYVPFRRQTQLPVFDTTGLDFNFGQLFRENRFSGVDRVGDANQVSIALTSSLLRSEDGRERLKLSVGQVQYFRNREVVLPDEIIETESASDIIFNARSQLAQNWDVSGQVQWDSSRNTAGKTTFRTTYRKNRNKFFTLAYRFRKDELEQTDIALIWPLSRWLNAISRWHYSLPEKRTLNTLLGLQYESCCWATSVFMSNFLNARGEASNQVVFFQLELKGLSSLGSRIDNVLRHEIPSYQ